jgi:hypothetical protein
MQLRDRLCWTPESWYYIQNISNLRQRESAGADRFEVLYRGLCAGIHQRRSAIYAGSDRPDEGMKHPSWVMCDNLVSVQKSALKQYVGSLSYSKLSELNRALAIALNLL